MSRRLNMDKVKQNFAVMEKDESELTEEEKAIREEILALQRDTRNYMNDLSSEGERPQEPLPCQKQKRRPFFLTFLLAIVGLLVGLLVWNTVFILLRLVIGFLGQIPFLGSILYYPAETSWALAILPPTTAIYAGSYCSAKISGTAKPLTVLVIILYLLELILLIASKSTNWELYAVSILSIITAAACFPANLNE